MRSYQEILDIAAERKGGYGAVLDSIEAPKSVEALSCIPDDRWLAQFSKGIFSAGLNWSVVENKWPDIEDAMDGFDVGRLAMMSPERFDALIQDKRIVRSPPKVAAIRDNAAFMREVAQDVGSFARKVAEWPSEDFAGLLEWLKKNGSRLGGMTGAYALRFMGKESYILSRDVVGRLVAEGVIDKAPTSKKAMAAVQEAFNTWKRDSGESLTTISRVLAQSTG